MCPVPDGYVRPGIQTWHDHDHPGSPVAGDTLPAGNGLIGALVCGPLAHKRLIDDVGDPRLGVELDPANIISPDNYYYTTELIDECFDLLGESIPTCHAQDTTITSARTTRYLTQPARPQRAPCPHGANSEGFYGPLYHTLSPQMTPLPCISHTYAVKRAYRGCS